MCSLKRGALSKARGWLVKTRGKSATLHKERKKEESSLAVAESCGQPRSRARQRPPAATTMARPPSLILRGLWLGPRKVTQEADFFEDRNLTHWLGARTAAPPVSLSRAPQTSPLPPFCRSLSVIFAADGNPGQVRTRARQQPRNNAGNCFLLVWKDPKNLGCWITRQQKQKHPRLFVRTLHVSDGAAMPTRYCISGSATPPCAVAS